MNKNNLFGLILILILSVVGLSTAKVQKTSGQKFKTWEISKGQSGGFAGITRGYALDSEGSLSDLGRSATSRKIDDAVLQEINRLVEELNLPAAKTRIVEGPGIYDGIYSWFTVTLDGREYKLEGNDFADEKQIVLTPAQKQTLVKLKEKLAQARTEAPPNNGVSAAVTPSVLQSDLTAPLDPARQKMVFLFEYRNYARGFQHNGWYLDEEGSVYKFSYEDIVNPQKPSERELKFKVYPKLIARIKPEVLAEKRKLLEKVAKGKYTEREAARDAGTSTVSAFLPDVKTGQYRKLKLVTKGDYEGANNTPEARALMDWLITVIPGN